MEAIYEEMNIFRKSREDKQYTIDKICDELKYSRRVIEALENDETDFLESPFNYYCARSYAKLLGFEIPKEEAQKFK